MNIQYRRHLWQAVRYLVGGAAEIGVAQGNYSKEMLEWPINLSCLYLVDRWQSVPTQKGDAANPQEWHEANFKRMEEQVLPHKLRVVILRGDSVEMARRVPPNSLRLVYIDADHSYEGVMRDSKAWLPKLVPGGVMAYHDYLNPAYGVHRAVMDFAMENYFIVNTIPEDKDEDAGAWFRLR